MKENSLIEKGCQMVVENIGMRLLANLDIKLAILKRSMKKKRQRSFIRKSMTTTEFTFIDKIRRAPISFPP